MHLSILRGSAEQAGFIDFALTTWPEQIKASLGIIS